MEASKRKKISTIISLVYSVLMFITFALYFLPYYTFPVAHTEAEFDHDAKTCTVTISVKEVQNSLASFLWFPAEAAGGHYLDDGSLKLRYNLDVGQQYDGYTLIVKNPDEFVAEQDFFTQNTTYIEGEFLKGELDRAFAKYNVSSLDELYDLASRETGDNITTITELYNTGYLKQLGINAMVAFPVVQMVLLIIFAIVCICVTRKKIAPHFFALPMIAGLVGIIGYLTQFSLLLGPTTIYLIMSVIITIVGAGNIYFSIVNIREYQAKRREILIKMGLR